jgi:hypothetical protein
MNEHLDNKDGWPQVDEPTPKRKVVPGQSDAKDGRPLCF